MKRILFIAYYYWPDTSIGAVRPTKIVKYLTKMGYTVDVLTHFRPGETYSDQYAANVFQLEEGESCFSEFVNGLRKTPIYQALRKADLKKNEEAVKAGAEATGENDVAYVYKESFLRHLSNSILGDQGNMRDRSYYKKGRKKLQDLLQEEYDGVISTFAPMSSHMLALEYKKRHPACVWISDFRDPPITSTQSGGLNRYYQRCLRQIYKYADYCTCVTDFALNTLKMTKTNQGHVISNGFDPEDLTLLSPKKPNKKFTFLYAGQFYHGKRDLSDFFKNIATLITEGKLPRDKVEIQYFGQGFVELKQMAYGSNIDDIIKDCGSGNRMESLQMQRNADVLLLCTWNTKEVLQCITGKYFEYVSSGHPILSLVTGDVPNSFIKQLTKKYGFGFSYEKLDGAAGLEDMKKYILQCYDEWQKTGDVKSSVDEAYLKSISHPVLAGKFAELLETGVNQ